MKRKLKVKVFHGILRKTEVSIHLDIPRQLAMSRENECNVDSNVRCVATTELTPGIMFIRGTRDIRQEVYDSKNDTSKQSQTLDCVGWGRVHVDKMWNSHKQRLKTAATWVAAEFEVKMKDKHG